MVVRKMEKEDKLLEIKGLSVDFVVEKKTRRAVHFLSYTLHRGATLGIVGESGSGKSVSSLAIMGLLPNNGSIAEGEILFYDNQQVVDLAHLPEHEMRKYRGRRISMIFQEPMTSLNPVQRCGDQVVEMLLLHHPMGKEDARNRVIELFEEVMLPRPEKIFESYPHEISGGQKQRVMIAMALICEPDILIADEPTTALDVTVQKTILQLLRQLQQRRQIGIIFISHDLGVVAQVADEVAVMYQGHLVEQGAAIDVLTHPREPYTQGLLACRPPIDTRPMHLPTVTDFLENKTIETTEQPSFDFEQAVPLLSVRDLDVEYVLKKNIFGKPIETLKGVDGISFDVYRGETFGLVGESGCGKTTLGRTILRLLDSASGTIIYDGKRLDELSSHQMRALRPKMQIVFQDPYSSLNPRITIGNAILEPLQNYGMFHNDKERKARVLELMEQVGLQADWYNRYPHEFSGGQRQRVCIARALVLEPELVICDESVSALDVSVQAQVLNLLNDLKRQFHYTYIFISHDLSVVRFLSDRILVMEKGKKVELGKADDIYFHPQHPYTKKLIEAIPMIPTQSATTV